MRAASSSSEMGDFNPRLYPLLLNSSIGWSSTAREPAPLRTPNVTDTFSHYIGGERLTAATVQSTNPSNTNGVLALVPQGGE